MSSTKARYEAGVWEQHAETADNPSGFVSWSRHSTRALAVKAARAYARRLSRTVAAGGLLSQAGGYREISSDDVNWIAREDGGYVRT